jgi:protein-L-isoaspartate(D-aspartate) O-methyltransferase
VDTEIPLGKVDEGQAMLAPRVEARLLQALEIARHEKVLEIGTGSGFMAALLGHKARHVDTLELNPALATQAAANLKRAGVMNVRVLQQDGAQGLGAEAPFDVILLSGSVAEVPEALLAQLKVGGRLAAIVGDEPVMRAQLIQRVSEAEYSSKTLFDTVAPRLQGFAARNSFAF